MDNIENVLVDEQASDEEESDGSVPECPPVKLKKPVDLRQFADLAEGTSQGSEFELEENYFDKCNESETPPSYFENEDVLTSSALVFNELDDSDDTESELDDKVSQPFRNIAQKMTKLTEDGGVLKRVIKPGYGPDVPEGAMVTVHYNSYYDQGDEPCDSTRLRNMPYKFYLNKGQVIMGMDIAVSSMKKQERSQFIFKPDYGFGKMGCPPRIPENATMLFEIELLGFVDLAAGDLFDTLSHEERKKLSFCEVLKAARCKHQQGNNAFKNDTTSKARTCYKKGIDILENCILKNEEEEEQQQRLLLKLHLNLSLVYIKRKEAELACTHCRLALEIDRNNKKALYRYGKAHLMMSNFERARHYLVRAQTLAPNDPDVCNELKQLNIKEKQHRITEQEMCQRMMQGLKMQKTQDDSGAAEAKVEDVTEEFKELVKEKLKKFLEDPYVTQIPFPSGMTRMEIACIATAAKELGLRFENIERGTKQMKIVKPQLETDEYDMYETS